MDPRRHLIAAAVSLVLAGPVAGCALLHHAPGASAAITAATAPPATALATATDGPSALTHPTVGLLASATPEPGPDSAPGAGSGSTPEPPSAGPEPTAATTVAGASTARPYLEVAGAHRRSRPRARTPTASATEERADEPAGGRAAIAAANRRARAASSDDVFVGGVLVFAWDPGRVYDVWTAPLRVTSLTLAPGETVTAKAAGDTVRWQIGEGISGSGASARTHVLIKPLQAGLETNLVLTTSQRVYLLILRSGAADAFNPAIAWDDGASLPAGADRSEPSVDDALRPVDNSVVTPQGPLDARYRIVARGRAPRWTPTAVFNDGVRTFIALAPEVVIDEAPALFVMAGGQAQLVNYRQADSLLIVDRVLDEAELRLGDRRPQVVRIHRLPGAAR